MEDYVSGSYYTDGVSYTAPSSYYTYGGDPTRIAQMATNEIDDDFGNLDYFSESSPDSVRVKPKHYIIDDEKKSDFETAAAALDVTLSNVGELGISFLGTLVGLFTSAYDTPSISGPENIPKLDFVDHNPTEDTLQKGNFLRSITATPTPYYATTHTPSPYFSTPAAQQYQDNHHAYSVHPVSTPAPQQFYQESTTAKVLKINYEGTTKPKITLIRLFLTLKPKKWVEYFFDLWSTGCGGCAVGEAIKPLMCQHLTPHK